MPGLGGFSRYELQERIGIGGMAEVFRARALDASGASHDVVVKKILPHHNDEADFRTMFMDEARIAANLDHPNVVRVLDLGRLDGDLFLTMEYVEGTDLLRLAEWMEGANRKMPIATALYLGCEVLKGLHHAHTRLDAMGRPLGIVHRDVTPQNVLVSLQGAVKLTDFGIARAANRLSHTTVGTIKGNLLYSSPEQVSGAPVDARSDVYSAGILLHRLLAGRHPFDGDDLPKIYQRALSGDIPPVSDSNKSVPTNLDRIIARATALVPGQRFASADELRLALEEFVRGKRLNVDLKALCADVRAKKSGLRAASKPDGRVLFTEAADDSSVLSTIEPLPDADSPSAQEEDGPTTVQHIPELAKPIPGLRPAAKSPAKPPPKPIGDPLDDSAGGPRLSNVPRPPVRTPPPQAIDEWENEEKTSRVPIPVAAPPPKPASLDAVDEEGTTRNPIPMPRKEPDPPRAASTILEPRPSPTPAPGTPMLSSRPPVATPDPDAAPTMFAELPPPAPREHPETTEETPALSALVREALEDSVPPEPAEPAARPPEVTTIATESLLPPLPEVTEPAPPSSSESVAPRPIPPPPEFTPPPPPPSESAADRSPAEPISTPVAEAPPPAVRAPRGRAQSLSATPAPPWEQPDPSAAKQPGRTPPPVRTPGGTPPPARRPGPTPAPTRPGAMSPIEPLALWGDSRAPLAPVAALVPPGEETLDLEDAPAVVGTIIEPASLPPPPTPSTTVAPARAPAPAPASRTPSSTPGSWLSNSRSAPGPGSEVEWPELPVPPIAAPIAPPEPVAAATPPAPDMMTAFDDVVDTDQTAATQRDVAFAQTLGLAAAGKPSARLEGHTDLVMAVATLRAGRFAVSASHDRTLRVWDLTRQSVVSVLTGHTGAITSVALGSEGMRVLSGSVDQTVRLWDSESGQLVASLAGHVEPVLAVAVSPDGRTAISGGQDRSVRVWDLTLATEQLVMSGHEQAVSSLAYSGDGSIAMSASLDGLIQIWNLLDGSMMGMFPTGVLGLRAIAISRDGRRLVFGGSDGRVQVWNVDQGTPVLSFEAHRRAVLSIALSPDGTRIATGSDDGYARVWNLLDGKAISQVESGSGSIHSIAFAFDGQSLVGAAGRRVCVWDLHPPQGQ